MAPPGTDPTTNTPLAPSVEKAYYRKCIELKRRLNEVEASNDEAKLKRVRLDRGIMKMRLERAYLLDELRTRMEYNVDESEGSGDETKEAPPVDRPHRDKRRRHNPPGQPAGSSMHAQQPTTEASRQPSEPHMKHEFGQPETLPSQPYPARGGAYLPTPEYAQQQPQHPLPGPPPSASQYTQQSSPYTASTPRPMVGGPQSFDRRAAAAAHAQDMDAAADGEQGVSAVSRQAGVTGEALSAGPTVNESATGERRVVSSGEISGAGEPENGFTAVNP